MYPDVRNAEVTHSIFIHIYTCVPLANKDMVNHENMTCYHFHLVIVQPLFIILKHFKLSLPNSQIHLSSAL